MSATSCFQPNSGEFSEACKECQVFILCADLATYRQAAEVCKHLVAQFDAELDFGFNCWNFNDLSDPVCAHSALKIAGLADIILLALADPKVPPVLSWWLESMPYPRLRHSGVLALVMDGAVAEPLLWEQACLQLKQSAQRLDMDFLPLCSAQNTTPDEVLARSASWSGSVAARPGQFTEPPSCDHWGLNE